MWFGPRNIRECSIPYIHPYKNDQDETDCSGRRIVNETSMIDIWYILEWCGLVLYVIL